MAKPIPSAIDAMTEHILNGLQHRKAIDGPEPAHPYFVAFQGPQGSGKTYLTSKIRDALVSSPHNLAVAVLSIDDLYLPHEGLVEVATSHPENPLLSGRGQPGTHDVELGTRLLNDLKRINEIGGSPVQFPWFDKSLFDGQGDRVNNGVLVRPPLDVVLFEGWCVGFCPIGDEEIEKRYDLPIEDIAGVFDLKQYSKESILQINDNLWQYVEWWSFFDSFIQIKPPDAHPYSYIYVWRLQQEHNMKAQNGGKGMTDEQVKRFIDRYIPGYIFFSGGIEEGYIKQDGSRVLPSWKGSGLKVSIDENRQLIAVDRF